MVWINNSDCYGCYLDYFEPIPGVTICKTKIKNTIYVGGTCQSDFRPDYTYLKLLPFMKKLIIQRQNEIGLKYSAVHIRRTDCIELAKNNFRFTTDEQFYSFLDKQENKIYIATDNEKTYVQFKERYNVPLNYHNTIPNSLRHTSLQDSIIDIYICVESEDFMGSGWSSFSDFIYELRKKI